MVLCVAAVHRSIEPQTRPYLELTDGWYRIYAEVDDCLARAVLKGKIAVGRKLAVSGSKVRSRLSITLKVARVWQRRFRRT
jgi:breast cancer 2 susceptibility protein